MWAILIASVGLLGAVAVFPLASTQARKGRINEALAVAGRSAVHTFDSAGMRRPDRWWSWSTTATPPQFTAASIAPGASYCIDSRLLLALLASTPPPTPALVAEASVFPYEWAITAPVTAANPPGPRMTRVAFLGSNQIPYLDRDTTGNTTGNLANTVAANRILAERFFFIEDDLAYFRPGTDELPSTVPNADARNDKSLPAVQQYALNHNGDPTVRQTRGELSWMATLVPKIDMVSGTASDQFLLSIVMFYQRSADLQLNNLNERVLNVHVFDGTSGGEVLLYWPATQTTVNEDFAKERLKLKANDWIMLSGNLVYGTAPNTLTIPRFQWYRVSDCDDDVEFAGAAAATATTPALPDRYQRFATLIGQDWMTEMVLQQATVVDGVLGVYEKTIRLEYGESL